MSVYRISYRYANSLMQLAEEKKIYSKIAQDADLIYSSLEASKELRTVLKSPVIKSTAKKNILTKIYQNKISKETESFLEFVVEKGTEDIVQSKFVVDERIIGGFVAELEDTVYDASVRHQLKLLRKKFAEEISI